MEFIVDPKPLVFKGSSNHFNDTELENWSMEERAKVWFEINALTATSIRKIQEKYTRGQNTYLEIAKQVKEIFRDQKIEFTEIVKAVIDYKATADAMAVENNEEYNYDLLDFIVKNWGGVTANGSDLECTKENKIKVLDNYPRLGTKFLQLSTTMMANYLEYKNAENEGEEKNSSDSQDGKDNEA
jgi:hypothetical protein